MCFFCGSPAFHNLSILVQDRKFSTRKFLPCNILFRDFHFCHVIFHLMLLNFRCILYGKLDAFCSHISISWLCFYQSVFLTYCQLFDHMSFFCRSPLINSVSILIYQFQLTSRYFFSTSQIGLCDFNCCCFIFKYKIYNNRILIFTGIGNSKFLYFLCIYKSGWRIEFFHIIFSIDWKISNKSNFAFGIG